MGWGWECDMDMNMNMVGVEMREGFGGGLDLWRLDFLCDRAGECAGF